MFRHFKKNFSTFLLPLDLQGLVFELFGYALILYK